MNNRHPNEHFVKKNVDKLREIVSKWNNKGETPSSGLNFKLNGVEFEKGEEPKSEYEHLKQLIKLNAQKIDLLNEKLELVHQIVKSHENMIEAQTQMIDSQTKALLELQSHKRLIEELQHGSEDFETRISNLENFMEELTEDA